MKIFVKENDKQTDEYCVMKECRGDVLLQINNAYYALNFMTPFLIGQEVVYDDFYYIKNLFPVENVSINNIINVIIKNVKHRYYEDLLPEDNINLSEWIEVYNSEKQ